MKITELEPKTVWKNFDSLNQIPRPSKHEEKAVAFLLKWGEEHGLETLRDEVGNVIFRKPATPGMEDRMGIILQAHIDMVPQKNNDTVHDFLTDPIKTRIIGDWVHATGTTLGADDGMGVAVAMSVLESKDLQHGPIEALITIDEETGMTGARALKGGMLNGDILINLDSETEGELYVGCAGGLDSDISLPYKEEAAPAEMKSFRLTLKGMRGGHSGMEIILFRANAVKQLVRIVLPLIEKFGARVSAIGGGNMRNAIPRESGADLLIPEANAAAAKEFVEKMAAEIKAEYAVADPDFVCTFEACEDLKTVFDHKSTLAIVRAVYACPNGIERMSDAMPGLVETSNNTSIFSAENGEFNVKTLMRSSVDSAKEELAGKIKAVFELAGAKVELSGSYPGWKPNMASPILNEMKAVYKGLYGNEPKVMAIHAGLECGLLGGTYPNWDMVSCGPTITGPHSPDERVNIASVQKWWKFVVEVLKNAPKK